MITKKDALLSVSDRALITFAMKRDPTTSEIQQGLRAVLDAQDRKAVYLHRLNAESADGQLPSLSRDVRRN